MGVSIQTFVTGLLQTNTYVVACDEACWIVDPGDVDEKLTAFVRDSGLSAEAIVLTHGHGDHIAGADQLSDEFDGITLICPADDASMLGDPMANLSQPFGFPVTVRPPDILIRPGQGQDHKLSLGSSEWQVLDTAGHTPGGVSYHCSEAQVVIVGDALFAGSIGRCDLPGADQRRLLANIRENLFSLPDDTRVLPGHGPETTIGVEKSTNPFL